MGVVVQEVVKQVQAPAPVVKMGTPGPIVTAAPVVETFAAPIVSAPIVETFAPMPAMAAPIMAAPVVETFAPMTTMAAPLAAPLAAPALGSISAGSPMTTMAAPMTTMAAPMATMGYPGVGTSYGLPPTIL